MIEREIEMLDTYVYVSLDKLSKVEGCGLKLSEWNNREVEIDGNTKKYISSFLNPRDDEDKFKSKDFRCLKVEVETSYCVIAEGAYYCKGFTELYVSSFIQPHQYKLGTYMKPECLIAKTIMPNEIKGIDKRLSFPVFYENSYKIYINNVLENLREKEPLLDEIMLYYYHENLAQSGKIVKMEDSKAKIAIFTDHDTEQKLVLNIPNTNLQKKS